MSNNNEQKQEAANAVRDFFKDEKVANAVVDMVVRNKPVGYSRRSNVPYYKERYGLAIRSVVDEMLQTREDQCYFYKDFPQISKHTLYLRIYQSIRYLLDYLDDENKTYSRWNEMVEITQERGVGVRISFIEEARKESVNAFRPHAVLAKKDIPKWKETLDKYLEDGRQTKPLHITSLALTPEEIEDVKASLKGLQNILCRVTATEIKVIKTA